ncbi:potassium channel family protein [Brachybacterium squillarum]|uniref:potassium channel family protein n=1 Tax=Brachybacterium squillarum TaxID=661979 RepID=UPI00026293D9|nr:potassium channel family protein [Brachybacterium squillarum]
MITVLASYLLPLDADRTLWWRALASSVVGAGLVVASSVTVYLLGAQVPDQFVGIGTRTDALYVTVVTMATIGYGDIHPVGQAARLLTTLLAVFDLNFVGALGSALSMQLRRRFPGVQG